MDGSYDILCEPEVIRTNNKNFIWENNVTVAVPCNFPPRYFTPRNVSKTWRNQETKSLKLFVFVDITAATYCPNVRTCMPRRKRPSVLQIATGSNSDVSTATARVRQSLPRHELGDDLESTTRIVNNTAAL